MWLFFSQGYHNWFMASIYKYHFPLLYRLLESQIQHQLTHWPDDSKKSKLSSCFSWQDKAANKIRILPHEEQS